MSQSLTSSKKMNKYNHQKSHKTMTIEGLSFVFVFLNTEYKKSLWRFPVTQVDEDNCMSPWPLKSL